MIQATNINFKYGSSQILYDVSFKADKKQIISLIGPNGSGKSTLLRCLCGLLPVKNQSILLDGKFIESCSHSEIAKIVAFLPQFQERLSSTSVYELISMGRSPYHASGWITTVEDREKIEWAMEYMGVTNMRNRMVNMLSGGERQRIWIAMILAQDTPIILMDEPVTYMDLKHQWNLLDTINDLKENCGKTIISVFHDINHAMEVSDIIYMLKDGRVYDKGKPDDIITEKAIHEVFEIPVHVCRFHQCHKSVVVPEGCGKCRRGITYKSKLKEGISND